MNAPTKPTLKAKDAPDLGGFDWTDPLRLEDQLTEDERMITASALQLHEDAHVFVDEEAASTLEMREYYDWIQAKKPGAPPQ